jgi:hypothetical protein
MQKCVQSTVLPPRVYGLLYFPVYVFIGRISFSIVDLIGSDSEGESLRRYATARRTPGSVATDRATTTKEESGNHKMVERGDFAQLLISLSSKITRSAGFSLRIGCQVGVKSHLDLTPLPAHCPATRSTCSSIRDAKNRLTKFYRSRRKLLITSPDVSTHLRPN